MRPAALFRRYSMAVAVPIRYLRYPFLVALCLVCTVISGCISWNRGLKPVQPSYGLTWNADVDSVTPTLKWKPYEDLEGKQDIRYELEVFDGRVIYLAQNDIRETHYTIREALESNRKYQWHVRPVWTAGGRTQRGQWNSKGYFFLTPIIFGWGVEYYNFRTPENKAP